MRQSPLLSKQTLAQFTQAKVLPLARKPLAVAILLLCALKPSPSLRPAFHTFAKSSSFDTHGDTFSIIVLQKVRLRCPLYALICRFACRLQKRPHLLTRLECVAQSQQSRCVPRKPLSFPRPALLLYTLAKNPSVSCSFSHFSAPPVPSMHKKSFMSFTSPSPLPRTIQPHESPEGVYSYANKTAMASI